MVSGPGTLTAGQAAHQPARGSCTVTLSNAATPGLTTVKARPRSPSAASRSTRATGDANAGDGPNAIKTWVDANIQIAPLTATNEVGDPHTFTAHVNVNDGSGFANAPAGRRSPSRSRTARAR